MTTVYCIRCDDVLCEKDVDEEMRVLCVSCPISGEELFLRYSVYCLSSASDYHYRLRPCVLFRERELLVLRMTSWIHSRVHMFPSAEGVLEEC